MTFYLLYSLALEKSSYLTDLLSLKSKVYFIKDKVKVQLYQEYFEFTVLSLVQLWKLILNDLVNLLYHK